MVMTDTLLAVFVLFILPSFTKKTYGAFHCPAGYTLLLLYIPFLKKSDQYSIKCVSVYTNNLILSSFLVLFGFLPYYICASIFGDVNNYPAVGTGVIDCPFTVNFTRTVRSEGPYKYNCLQLYIIYHRRGDSRIARVSGHLWMSPTTIIADIPINYNLYVRCISEATGSPCQGSWRWKRLRGSMFRFYLSLSQLRWQLPRQREPFAWFFATVYNLPP